MSICKPSLLILLRAEHEAAAALEALFDPAVMDKMEWPRWKSQHIILLAVWRATVKAVEEAMK